MVKRIFRKAAVKLGAFLHGVENNIAQATLPRFASAATGLVMQRPRQLSNPHLIHLGDDVKLGPNSVLRALAQSPGAWLAHPKGEHIEQTFSPALHIGNRVTATGALQVVAHKRITIEDDVMFATNVFMCDGLHGFERGDVPYKYQGIFRVAPIRIGRGAWIGQNVVIMPGVTIGELAIIGANSVVTKDIPAKTIAIGAPAQVTKRWDDQSEAWTPVTDTKAAPTLRATLGAK